MLDTPFVGWAVLLLFHAVHVAVYIQCKANITSAACHPGGSQ